MELIEYEGTVPDTAIKNPLPLKQLLAQHRKRYVVVTSLGEFVLKPISMVDLEETAIRVAKKDPEYMEKMGRANELWQKSNTISLNVEEAQELMAIGETVGPYVKEFYLACFDREKTREIPETVEHLDVLLGALRPDERLELLDLLTRLVRGTTEKEVSLMGLALAKEYDIPLTDDLTVENMTAEQASALSKVLSEKVEVAQKQMNELRRAMKQ